MRFLIHAKVLSGQQICNFKRFCTMPAALIRFGLLSHFRHRFPAGEDYAYILSPVSCLPGVNMHQVETLAAFRIGNITFPVPAGRLQAALESICPRENCDAASAGIGISCRYGSQHLCAITIYFSIVAAASASRPAAHVSSSPASGQLPVSFMSALPGLCRFGCRRRLTAVSPSCGWLPHRGPSSSRWPPPASCP